MGRRIAEGMEGKEENIRTVGRNRRNEQEIAEVG